MAIVKQRHTIWLCLFLIVVLSNIAIYQFALIEVNANTQAVVIGSLIDLMIVAPLLWMAYRKSFTLKKAILLIALGSIIARITIPAPYLAPYQAVTWVGLGMEAVLFLMELLLIIVLLFYLPKIIQATKRSSSPLLFAFVEESERHVKKQPIIQMICYEGLMFYYAIMGWKRAPALRTVTIHQKTSYLAMMIMLIHGIVLESIGFHWLLHEKSAVLAYVLLFVNIYGVIFIVAHIQAIRTEGITVQNRTLYMSLGLMQRVAIPLANIQALQEDVPEGKLAKDIANFAVLDFEPRAPQAIIHVKEPVIVYTMYGRKKKYKKIAFRCDDYASVKTWIETSQI